MANNQQLHDFQNQNKLLTSEKWELAQEKFLLEGQIKQMEVMAFKKSYHDT